MKIGELAEATGTPVETIRFYEKEGLLPAAPRSDANYRIYGASHVERLGFIRQCRSLDMALDEVRALLAFKDTPNADCGQVNALVDQHIDHVAARIHELRSLQVELKRLRAQCHTVRASAHCGVLQELSGTTRAPSPARTRVVHRINRTPRHVAGSHR